MLAASRARIESTLPEDAVVLDIGGWADPLPRADWVVDLMPYETRGLYAEDGGGGTAAPERFSAGTWIRRDICDRVPLPFGDDQFDFVVCSHTLEDIRDPIGVCAEIVRVGTAGYIEVPSRLEEQSWGVAGPFVGWSHHRWLIDRPGGRLEFMHKPGALQALGEAQIPADAYAKLTPEQRVIAFFWEGSFDFGERLLFDQAEHDADLMEVARPFRDAAAAPPPARPRAAAGRRHWRPGRAR